MLHLFFFVEWHWEGFLARSPKWGQQSENHGGQMPVKCAWFCLQGFCVAGLASSKVLPSILVPRHVGWKRVSDQRAIKVQSMHNQCIVRFALVPGHCVLSITWLPSIITWLIGSLLCWFLIYAILEFVNIWFVRWHWNHQLFCKWRPVMLSYTKINIAAARIWNFDSFLHPLKHSDMKETKVPLELRRKTC